MSPKHYSSHRVICWRITRKCNRTCRFCLSKSSPSFVNPSMDVFNDVNRLAALGVEKISYTGGEPTLHPDLHRIIRRANELKIKQILTTNGDAPIFQYVKWIGTLEYLRLSFYGTQSVHDSIMGSGHYYKLLNLAKSLTKKGLRVCANLMLYPRSINCLEGFFNDVLNSSIHKIVILTYINTGIDAIDKDYSFATSSQYLNKTLKVMAKFTHRFPYGIKVNNYSENNFFIVLNDLKQFTLPNDKGEPTFIMGDLYDNFLSISKRKQLPAFDALEYIWRSRYETNAIISL